MPLIETTSMKVLLKVPEYYFALLMLLISYKSPLLIQVTALSAAALLLVQSHYQWPFFGLITSISLIALTLFFAAAVGSEFLEFANYRDGIALLSVGVFFSLLNFGLAGLILYKFSSKPKNLI